MYLFPSLVSDLASHLAPKLFWAGVAAFPVTYYVYGLLRLPIRAGEVEHIRAWLRHDDGFEWTATHVKEVTNDADVLMTANTQAYIARRNTNDGDPFVIINLDKLPTGALGPKYWRMRLLVGRVARGVGIPAVWAALTAWNSAVSRPGAVYKVVEAKGREFVCSRTWRGETTFFLSGFDRNERPALYFLTQLPRPVASIVEAREALKPPSVLMAEQQGRKVFRQGDMFAIPTKVTTAQIHAAGGVIHPKLHSLYGTAHTADLVADLPDGTQLVWGQLLHRPSIINDNRKPDHHPTRLKPSTWHLVAKNTTPMRLRKGVTS